MVGRSGSGEAIEIKVEDQGSVDAREDASGGPLYGIDGPRRRPRSAPWDRSPAIDPPDAHPDPVVVLPAAGVDAGVRGGRPTVRDRWLDESRERSVEPTTERPEASAVPGAGLAPSRTPDLDGRFEALRVEMTTELGRQVDAAVARMQVTFEQEIEALRSLNREEAKRSRSTNGEAFVRIRAADTQELERIRRAVDEGVERLCSVLEGQLDRVWGANDVELERIRSAGADRLEEVHDLLMHELERVRAQASAPARPWYRRKART